MSENHGLDQPGCRKKVSGMPPNFELLLFNRCLQQMMPQIAIFNQVMMPPNLFKDLKGAEA
jgi:hypothetical protein